MPPTRLAVVRRAASRAARRVGVLALLLAGCASPPGTAPASAPDEPRDAAPAVDAAAVVARHNARVAQLVRFHARGVVELRWTDDDGTEHFEPQINAHFWIHRPRRTALRGEKLGEVLFWLGSDAERFWMFDLLGEPSRLVVGSHDTPTDDLDLPLPVRPLALLPLSGLAPIPGDAVTSVATAAEGVRVVASFEIAGEALRVVLDPVTGIPVRVELLDPAGDARVTSRLARPRSVDVAGVSRAALPRTPTLIDIADREARLSIRLALDEPDDVVADRFFELDRLRTAMPVARTEGLDR